MSGDTQIIPFIPDGVSAIIPTNCIYCNSDNVYYMAEDEEDTDKPLIQYCVVCGKGYTLKEGVAYMKEQERKRSQED